MRERVRCQTDFNTIIKSPSKQLIENAASDEYLTQFKNMASKTELASVDQEDPNAEYYLQNNRRHNRGQIAAGAELEQYQVRELALTN